MYLITRNFVSIRKHKKTHIIVYKNLWDRFFVNNFDINKSNFVDGYNEVIIYDFKTDKYSSYLKDNLIENDVRTITEGRSQILPNGGLFIEEANYGRTLFFNSDGSLRWTHVNRAENGKVHRVGWSRILHTQEDIQTVKQVIGRKGTCNE